MAAAGGMFGSLLPRARCAALLGLFPATEQVKQIHAQMIVSSLSSHPRSIAKLIESYCRAPQSKPYADQIISKGAMLHDRTIYIDALRACARLVALRGGRQLHAQILKTGYQSDLAIQTTGIHFYASCKGVDEARRLFDEMPERSCVTWNAMMSGYCLNGCANEVLAMFKRMMGGGVLPTERTALPLLSACSQLGELSLGSATHALICKTIGAHHADVFIGTALVDMYAKCGSLSIAFRLFDGMPVKNVLSWTAMTSGLAMHGEGKRALEMLEAMHRDGLVPNVVTFTCLLSACCHAGLVQEGLHLFDMMTARYGVEPGKQHYGCVVDLLGRVGMVEEARQLIERMPVAPDAVVWRALLSACKIHGRVEMAEEVGRMLLKEEGVTAAMRDVCEDYVALSNVYASAERWEDVSMIRKEMKSRGIQNKAGCSSVQVYKLY